ncbi:MAG: hypothetical protein JWN08_2350 [Frankiales bacterium]|nr:hypothetical protein [Frankiales bacterium]
MFRDSRGVVHTVSSADPLSDLPPGAAKALQAALMAPASDGATVDVGSVLERCDAVRELVERWQDAFFSALPDDIDLEEEARWAAEAGMSLDEVEAGYSEQEDDEDELDVDLLGADYEDEQDEELDELVELLERDVPDEDDPRRVLPEELVAVLERELLLLPLRVRLEALVAAVDLVQTWSDLVADHEKLLGHLVLAHAEPQEVTGHELLVDRHAALHAVAGPAHAAP